MAANNPAIEDVVQRIRELRLWHPVRVAVDGRTASGKTTFAHALATALKHSGRRVIQVSIDGFHRPRIERYRQGRLSHDGYYEDAHDLKAVRELLLDPFAPGGDRIYVMASFDLDRDEPSRRVPERAPNDVVLIVDGEFLQRPELKATWDFIVFLNVSAEVARRRGVERDASFLENASELYDHRYGPAFDRYERECRPAEHADVVITN